MSAPKDLTNQKFGYLIAECAIGSNKWGSKLWRCRCECGNTKVYPSGKLVSGRATNCGCKTSEIKSKNASVHGITANGKPRTLIIWGGMKARCLNPKATSYKSYGARGISICDEWLSFENFHNWAIGNGYGEGLTLDRINPDGNYCPENCKWTPRLENIRNQRHTKHIVLDGEDYSINRLAREFHISKSTMYRKLELGEEKLREFIQESTGKGQVYFANLFLKKEDNHD